MTFPVEVKGQGHRSHDMLKIDNILRACRFINIHRREFKQNQNVDNLVLFHDISPDLNDDFRFLCYARLRSERVIENDIISYMMLKFVFQQQNCALSAQ